MLAGTPKIEFALSRGNEIRIDYRTRCWQRPQAWIHIKWSTDPSCVRWRGRGVTIHVNAEYTTTARVAFPASSRELQKSKMKFRAMRALHSVARDVRRYPFKMDGI